MERLILRESLDDQPPTVSGRHLTIRIATYNRVYDIGRGQRERILRGAFKDAQSRPRGALRYAHRGEHEGEIDSLDNFHGVMTNVTEEGDHVIAEFDVFEGPTEDKLLRIVNAGAVRGASLAAVIRESRMTRTPAGPVREITRFGQLDGVSITPSPAYDDAEILAVRERLQAREARIRAEQDYWRSLRLVR